MSCSAILLQFSFSKSVLLSETTMSIRIWHMGILHKLPNAHIRTGLAPSIQRTRELVAVTCFYPCKAPYYLHHYSYFAVMISEWQPTSKSALSHYADRTFWIELTTVAVGFRHLSRDQRSVSGCCVSSLTPLKFFFVI